MVTQEERSLNAILIGRSAITFSGAVLYLRSDAQVLWQHRQLNPLVAILCAVLALGSVF